MCLFLFDITTMVGGVRKDDLGEFNNGDLRVGSSMVDGVQGLDDIEWEWADSCRSRVFFLVGKNLLSQAKSKIYHAVVPGFAAPHLCKYFFNGAEVLLNGALLDGYPP